MIEIKIEFNLGYTNFVFLKYKVKWENLTAKWKFEIVGIEIWIFEKFKRYGLIDYTLYTYIHNL